MRQRGDAPRSAKAKVVAQAPYRKWVVVRIEYPTQGPGRKRSRLREHLLRLGAELPEDDGTEIVDGWVVESWRLDCRGRSESVVRGLLADCGIHFNVFYGSGRELRNATVRKDWKPTPPLHRSQRSDIKAERDYWENRDELRLDFWQRVLLKLERQRNRIEAAHNRVVENPRFDDATVERWTAKRYALLDAIATRAEHAFEQMSDENRERRLVKATREPRWHGAPDDTVFINHRYVAEPKATDYMDSIAEPLTPPRAWTEAEG